MKCKAQALICVLACSLVVSGCALRVPPKPVTSSEWILEVCAGFNEFIAGFQGNFEADLLTAMSSAEHVEDFVLSDLFSGTAAEGEDLLAVFVAVEPRVPETDLEGYRLLREVAAFTAETHGTLVETLLTLERELEDDRVEEDDITSLLNQVFAVLEKNEVDTARLEEKLLAFDSSTLSPETLRSFDECWIPKPPNCLDPAQSIICPGTPLPIDPGVPWIGPFRLDADTGASDLAGIGLFESDMEGEGWIHESLVAFDQSMVAFAVGTMAAGCFDTTTGAAPPLPLFDAPVTTSLGSIENAGDLGMLVYSIDQYRTVDQAREVVAAVQAAVERCGHPLSASPPVISHISMTPYAQSAIFEASPFGEFIPNAPTGEAEYVYLADGPFVALLMSDPYGVAAPVIDDAKDLLGARLQSAATSWEDQ